MNRVLRLHGFEVYELTEERDPEGYNFLVFWEGAQVNEYCSQTLEGAKTWIMEQWNG